LKTEKILTATILVFMIGSVSAVSGNFTGDNSTDYFNITNSDIDTNLSVNQFGETVENISSVYVDNQTSSRNFNVSVKGNVTEFLDYPSSFTLFENESDTFPVVANVPSNQDFGAYNGSLKMTALENNNFSEKINISVKVFDDIKPSITGFNISNVQATKNVEWSLEIEDNLGVDKVKGEVIREFEEQNGNTTETVNKTIQNFDFNQSGGQYKYIFKDTDIVGNYYLNANASDESGNTVKEIYPFKVNGLESINVLTDNFVFDTFRPKDQSTFKLVNSSLDGRNVSFSLKNLSYGGNASVKLGVLPPSGESPEIVDVGESRSYTEAGVYQIVLIHTGSNEVEGTHSVNGELVVGKPDQHVKPRKLNVVFSGTVKNLDKPPETCTRVAEFNSCIGYSLDSVRSLFDDQYRIEDQDSRDFAYMISRVPTGDVEGSDEWGSELSLTMGQYNKTVAENERLENRVDYLVAPIWKTLFFISLLVSAGIVYFVYSIYPTFELDRSKFSKRSINNHKNLGESNDSGILGGLKGYYGD
jgi:hypothetical protein